MTNCKKNCDMPATWDGRDRLMPRCLTDPTGCTCKSPLSVTPVGENLFTVYIRKVDLSRIRAGVQLPVYVQPFTTSLTTANVLLEWSSWANFVIIKCSNKSRCTKTCKSIRGGALKTSHNFFPIYSLPTGYFYLSIILHGKLFFPGSRKNLLYK